MHIYTRRIPMESSANEIIIKEESRQQSYEISQLKSRNEELLSVIKIISFELDNKSLIIVSLADNDYNAPEAFDIHLDTGEIIVW